jgi:NADH dehydrogenase
VGAGPTGVELAGALAEIATDTLRNDFRSIKPENARILLLEGSPHVLPTYPEDLSVAAERSLVKLGVRPRCGVRVTNIDAEGVTVEGGEHIAAKTVLWAAGVKPSDFGAVLADHAGAELNRQGQVKVEPDLTIGRHPEIFVIGDLAYLEQDGHPLPGVAPVAMQQGRYVARVIRDRIAGKATKPFRYFDKGSLAVIGRKSAVVEIRKLHITGVIAWLIWLFVHLTYRFHTMGNSVPDVRPWRAADYRRSARAGSERDGSDGAPLIQVQAPNPDIPIAHGIPVILQHQRILRRLRHVLGEFLVLGRPHDFPMQLDQHSVVKHRHCRGLD